MKSALLALALLAPVASVQAATGEKAQDSLQAWIESCESDRGQHGATACAIVEAARSEADLDAVLSEIVELHSSTDGSDNRSIALQTVQAGWETQVQSDIDALFPLTPGEEPSLTYGSSYMMQMAMVRALARRQRVAFLCNTWLPEHNRRHRLPDESPSACQQPSATD